MRYVVQYSTGQYEKLGGGRTNDLQQAQVIGWTPAGIRRWEKYGTLIPVEIKIS